VYLKNGFLYIFFKVIKHRKTGKIETKKEKYKKISKNP